MLRIFDQHTRAYQRASDAPDEGIEQALELRVGRGPCTMKPGAALSKCVGTVERQHVEVDVSCGAWRYVE